MINNANVVCCVCARLTLQRLSIYVKSKLWMSETTECRGDDGKENQFLSWCRVATVRMAYYCQNRLSIVLYHAVRCISLIWNNASRQCNCHFSEYSLCVRFYCCGLTERTHSCIFDLQPAMNLFSMCNKFMCVCVPPLNTSRLAIT